MVIKAKNSAPIKSHKAGYFSTLLIMLRSIWVTFRYSATVLIKSTISKCTREDVDILERAWAARILNIVKLRYEIKNPHGFVFQPGHHYIIMSNHQSHYDIPLILDAFCEGSIRMIAKKELFKIPIWGIAMKKAEFISIDRDNRNQAYQDLEIAKEMMRSGIVVWIAPEGTRTRNGELQPFKNGGFFLALQTGATIVPVGIKGTAKILPPDTWDFSIGEEATLAIGQPIEASAYKPYQRKQLVQEVEKSIRLALGE